MERLILEVHESSVAGDSWSWKYWLESEQGGGFTLSAERDVFWQESEEKYEGDELPSKQNLKDGVEIYEALVSLLWSSAEYSHTSEDIKAAAEKLTSFGESLAKEFLLAEETLEQRATTEAKRVASERKSKLEPYQQQIESYLKTVPDDRMRWGPPRRTLVRVFIENYVLENAQLPTGKHRVEDPWGSSCFAGVYDFGNLGKS